ncbi:unnamed protein product (macronuclear) [Paramecium tetraurelia]|uniref:Uncharacterized protein n=1 Tax=Paramecium tetraurelia TaxID=5888 RepID=A0EFN8_PARTE|nr:uncharacterized protein GSPATT00026452001 [Paramecium tetraurelia]CAK94129.1 unnamed protein product [Paramecium tetraurelia]|eukprot:XP_001461502.1 hypothetical protein (macronuclear) [Paramecium tetraurelia strain d4-2]
MDQNIKIMKNNYLIDRDYSTQQHNPLNDITNIQIKYIKSLQQSLQNSKLSKCSSNNNNKQQEGSPIELFNDQNILDSLDNIKVFDPQQHPDHPSDSTNNYNSMDLSQARMSTIQENENEEDECVYQIVENHQQQARIENTKKQKDQLKIKQCKSKTLYY